MCEDPNRGTPFKVDNNNRIIKSPRKFESLYKIFDWKSFNTIKCEDNGHTGRKNGLGGVGTQNQGR